MSSAPVRPRNDLTAGVQRVESSPLNVRTKGHRTGFLSAERLPLIPQEEWSRTIAGEGPQAATSPESTAYIASAGMR